MFLLEGSVDTYDDDVFDPGYAQHFYIGLTHSHTSHSHTVKVLQ